MHITPLKLVALAVATAFVVAACGQVTGLSNDYTYDLEGGAQSDGASEGAATNDGATSDGATDARADATNKCTASQTLKTAQKLQSYNGSMLCNTCLATSCCNDVDTCTANQECNKAFSCKIECSQQASGDRTQCLKSCSSSGNPNALFTTTVGACSASACKQECGLL